MAESADKYYNGYHTMQWHITHRCNLRCSHCYQDDYSQSMSYDELLIILDRYNAFLKSRCYFGQINLTGGEPLSCPSFFSLAKEIRSRGIALSILTNGTLITPETARKIAMLGPLFVQISLDGCRKTHDSIRGKGNFQRALNGIDLLKEQHVPVLVSFTAQSRNIRDFTRLERICRKHHVDKLWWDRVVIPEAEDENRLSLSTEEFKVMLSQTASVYRKSMRKYGNSIVHPSRALQFLGFDHPEECSIYSCSAGKNLIVVLANGDVMPCRRLPKIIGNILENDFDTIITQSDLMKELNASDYPEECSSCPHRESCKGGAKCVTFAKTGQMFIRDVNCYFS